MPDQLTQAVKEERNQRLLELVNESGARQYQAFVGRQVQILVEGPSKKNPARLTGRTRCNKIVVFDGAERYRGQLLDVKIPRAGSFTLYGAAGEGRQQGYEFQLSRSTPPEFRALRWLGPVNVFGKRRLVSFPPCSRRLLFFHARIDCWLRLRWPAARSGTGQAGARGLRTAPKSRQPRPN